MEKLKHEVTGRRQGTVDEEGTSVLSVRLSNVTLAELEKEAGRKGTELRTLVREVLTHHTRWWKYKEKIPLMLVPQRTIAESLEILSEKEVTQMARSSGRMIASQLARGETPIDTPADFLGLFTAWLGPGNVGVAAASSGSYVVTVEHHLGRKWSLYIGELAEAALAEIPGVRGKGYEAANDRLTISVAPRFQY